MGNAGGSLHFGGDDEEEGEEDVVEQPRLTEGSGVPIEDKEGYSSTTMTGDHPAAQSVSPSHSQANLSLPMLLWKAHYLPQTLSLY